MLFGPCQTFLASRFFSDTNAIFVCKHHLISESTRQMVLELAVFPNNLTTPRFYFNTAEIWGYFFSSLVYIGGRPETGSLSNDWYSSIFISTLRIVSLLLWKLYEMDLRHCTLFLSSCFEVCKLIPTSFFHLHKIWKIIIRMHQFS